MKKNFITIFLLSVFICLYAGPDLGRETKMDSVLASVNGEPVTLLDIMLETNREESRLAALYSGETLYAKTYELRKNVVNFIIDRKLVYNQYKQNPFEIQEQHIEDMVDFIARSMGDGTRESLERRLRVMGSTMREIRVKAKEKIAVDILLHENCDKRVSVTPFEVYQTYQKNPDKWGIPAQVHLQVIQVSKEKKHANLDIQKVLQNLKDMLKNADEATFKRIAKENSDGLNAEAGGDMGWVELEYLRPEFSGKLKQMKISEINGPIETPEGYFFIRSAGKKDARMQPFEKVRKTIETELRAKQKALQYKIYIDELKKEAVVKYYF